MTTDPNIFVRLADVEAMFTGRIANLDQTLTIYAKRMSLALDPERKVKATVSELRAISVDILTVSEQRYGAQRANRDLQTQVPTFTLVDGRGIDGADTVLLDADDNAVEVQ